MNNRTNFLAVCLLDALEDEDQSFQFEMFMKKYDANPNVIIMGRGIAPIHYACGMENIEMGERVTELMLNYGGNPNTISEEGITPLHVACLVGRPKIVKMLLERGGDMNAIDNEKKTPVLYAVYENHFDCIKVIQNFVFEKKIEKKLLVSANTINSPNPKKLNKDLLTIQMLESKKFTPNRLNYNFDITSPYYINITHRTHKSANRSIPVESEPQCPAEPIAAQENLFELTEENLEEYSKHTNCASSPFSMIQAWRDKCQRSKGRKSILKVFDNIDTALSVIMAEDNLNFTNTMLSVTGSPAPEARKSVEDTAFGKLLDQLKASKSPSDVSFKTAQEEIEERVLSESNFIRSPRDGDYIVQMAEHYMHTDTENGIIFYEQRYLAETQIKSRNNLNKSQTSISTNITVPPDYDTEALRAELTTFGEPPGPITKSTKRLYTKRLIKYKRDTERLENVNKCGDEKNDPKFSVELERTVQKKDWFERIHEHMELEKAMSCYFQSNNQKRLKLREGNLKTSFIYMLIDPRISDNLPAESTYMSSHEVWKRFLKSIFYVGKGKSSRPYSHLYDAMKAFSRNREVVNIDGRLQVVNESLTIPVRSKLFNSQRKPVDSTKLQHILDIWRSQNGVVCLHVFHNILPAEAYTREAAIIEALGLNHLTNLKRGDFYGPCQSWTMRTRKCLGIALLYKAMQIFLAEGESQLLPSDLI